MNVSELKKMLEKYPDDMEILNVRMSDYAITKESDWSIINGVEENEWVMRSHPTMSIKRKLKEKQYLVLKGN